MIQVLGSNKMLFTSEAAAISFLISEKDASFPTINQAPAIKTTRVGITGAEILLIGGGIILTGILIYYTIWYIEEEKNKKSIKN